MDPDPEGGRRRGLRSGCHGEELPLEDWALHIDELTGLLAGSDPSPFRGDGVEAAGVRPYVPGDDVRRMDARVTARRHSPHVREFIADRQAATTVVLETSRMAAWADPRPLEAARAAAAALALARLAADHPTGWLQLGEAGSRRLPPRAGPAQRRRLLEASRGHAPPPGPTLDLPDALLALAGSGPRGLVLLISDFGGSPETWGPPLHAVARKHDLVPVRVRAPLVGDLPRVGLLEVVDPASGRRQVVDTDDPSWRDRARRREEEWDEAVRGGFRGIGLSPLTLEPGYPLAPQLLEFFRTRAPRGA